MIHFDFTVSDADAENIFSILRKQIDINNLAIVKLVSQPSHVLVEHQIHALHLDNDYIEGLIRQITATRIEE